MPSLISIVVGLAAMLTGTAFVPLGGAALGSWVTMGWWSWFYNLSGSGSFVPVAKDVYKLDLWWRPLPVSVFPLTAMLVKDGSSWVLIDAGAPDGWSQRYASTLVAAVKKQLPRKASLDTILLTHGHPDHTGALPQLLRDYPSAQLVLHQKEAPFLTGRQSYVPTGALVVKVLQGLGLAGREQVKVGEGRMSLLRGDGGDLSAYGISSLRWIATPGHSPGHISFLHAPSATLIAGDAVHNIFPSLALDAGLSSLFLAPLRAAGRGGGALSGLVGSGVLRMLPRAVTDALPAPLLGLLDSPLLGGGGGGSPEGTVSQERVISGSAAVMGGGGDESSEGTVVQGGKVEGQKATDVKVPYTWGLPKAVVKVKPMFICPHPTCNELSGHESLCKLASLRFKTAIPFHDGTGKGLSHDELAAFASALPACQ